MFVNEDLKIDGTLSSDRRAEGERATEVQRELVAGR